MLLQAKRSSAVESGIAAGNRAVDEDSVVVIVAATRGSTPREAGAQMVVSLDDNRGSIGGGHLEYEAIRLARLLPAGATGYLRFTLGASLGQCCGGEVELAFIPAARHAAITACLAQDATGSGPRWLALTHRPGPDRLGWHGPPTTGDVTLVGSADSIGLGDHPAADVAGAGFEGSSVSGLGVSGTGVSGTGVALVRGEPAWLALGVGPASPRVLLCGAGHIGIALARLLQPLDCELDWVDGRDDLAALRSLEVASNAAGPRWRDADPVQAAAQAAPGSWLVVMTHDHGLDYDIITAALRREDLAFIGLIGSMTKRRRFEHRLRADGFDDKAIARLCCPLGQRQTRDKSPQAIAIIVAAQLLAAWDDDRRESSIPRGRP